MPWKKRWSRRTRPVRGGQDFCLVECAGDPEAEGFDEHSGRGGQHVLRDVRREQINEGEGR